MYVTGANYAPIEISTGLGDRSGELVLPGVALFKMLKERDVLYFVVVIILSDFIREDTEFPAIFRLLTVL